MKKFILITLFTLTTVSHIFAQIKPIVNEVNGNYLRYWTQSKGIYENLGKSQSIELKNKVVKEVKIKDGPTDIELNSCFSTSRLNELEQTNGIIMLVSYFDQTGTVKAAGIYINKRYFILTNEEIECILTKLMNKKLKIEFNNGFFNFYYKVSGSYIPKQTFINLHEEEDPDLDEKQY